MLIKVGQRTRSPDSYRNFPRGNHPLMSLSISYPMTVATCPHIKPSTLLSHRRWQASNGLHRESSYDPSITSQQRTRIRLDAITLAMKRFLKRGKGGREKAVMSHSCFFPSEFWLYIRLALHWTQRPTSGNRGSEMRRVRSFCSIFVARSHTFALDDTHIPTRLASWGRQDRYIWLSKN